MIRGAAGSFVGRFCFRTCCTTAGLFLSFFPAVGHANFDVKKDGSVQSDCRNEEIEQPGRVFRLCFHDVQCDEKKKPRDQRGAACQAGATE